MGRSPVDRFIDLIEVTAAGFLAVVTLLTFVSVFLRYLFAWSIPDAYDFSRLLLGILIFWGMAVASYRGDHITVDLLWTAVPPPARRTMDVFSALVTLIARCTFTWMFAGRCSIRAPTMSVLSICANRSGSTISSPGWGLPPRFCCWLRAPCGWCSGRKSWRVAAMSRRSNDNGKGVKQ